MLQGVTGCYSVLQGATSFYRVIHGVKGCNMVLHSVDIVLHGITRCYTLVRDVRQLYSIVLHAVTCRYTVLHACMWPIWSSGHIGIFPKKGPYEFSPKLKSYYLVCFWTKYAYNCRNNVG